VGFLFRHRGFLAALVLVSCRDARVDGLESRIQNLEARRTTPATPHRPNSAPSVGPLSPATLTKGELLEMRMNLYCAQVYAGNCFLSTNTGDSIAKGYASLLILGPVANSQPQTLEVIMEFYRSEWGENSDWLDYVVVQRRGGGQRGKRRPNRVPTHGLHHAI
jgi:hypothetical protein